MKKMLMVLVAAAALVAAPVMASAEPHEHGEQEEHEGHVFIGGGFGWGGPYWGGFWGPYWGTGWWGPGEWGPGVWGPGYYDRYANTGTIKIDSHVKDAEVFINGSYLGTVGHNKTIHLRPGAYKVEIREPGRQPYVASVYVTVDKTLHLHPEG